MYLRFVYGLLAFLATMLSVVVADGYLGLAFLELGIVGSLFLNAVFGTISYGISLLYFFLASNWRVHIR
jgi:hypothetical protein